jgi:hypothetical protein
MNNAEKREHALLRTADVAEDAERLKGLIERMRAGTRTGADRALERELRTRMHLGEEPLTDCIEAFVQVTEGWRAFYSKNGGSPEDFNGRVRAVLDERRGEQPM